MTAAILYGSPTKLSNAHFPVGNMHGQNYYVRMVIAKGFDCEGLLKHAKPLEGETVLNTVDLPDCEEVRL